MKKIVYARVYERSLVGAFAHTLDAAGHETKRVVEIPMGTWCATETVAWSGSSRFRERSRDGQHVPFVGDSLAVELSDGDPSVAAKWAYRDDWHDDSKPPPLLFDLRVVRGTDAELEVLWELNRSSDTPVYRQILEMSAQFPRTGDDGMSINYAVNNVPRVGLRIQLHDGNQWITATDIRAPYAEVPDELKQPEEAQ